MLLMELSPRLCILLLRSSTFCFSLLLHSSLPSASLSLLRVSLVLSSPFSVPFSFVSLFFLAFFYCSIFSASLFHSFCSHCLSLFPSSLLLLSCFHFYNLPTPSVSSLPYLPSLTPSYNTFFFLLNTTKKKKMSSHSYHSRGRINKSLLRRRGKTAGKVVLFRSTLSILKTTREKRDIPRGSSAVETRRVLDRSLTSA